jgi:hypothetical protein
MTTRPRRLSATDAVRSIQQWLQQDSDECSSQSSESAEENSDEEGDEIEIMHDDSGAYK